MNNFYVKLTLIASVFMLADASILNRGEPDYKKLFAQLNEPKDRSGSPWKIGSPEATDRALAKVIWFEMKSDNNMLSLLNNDIGFYTQEDEDRYVREVIDSATAVIKAVETSDHYIIYIKRPEMFFYRDKNPLFMIGSYNHYGPVIYVMHSENGCDNGEFLLPGPVAREFCSNNEYMHPIESKRLSESEIELIIPKDTNQNFLYDWWYGKRGTFSRIDMLDEPAVLSPVPPAYAFLMNVCNRISGR